jgi:hypothetical protein
MAAVMTGTLGIGYLIGLAVYAVSIPLRSARALDPVFVSRGLIPGNYMVFGRQYHGHVQGRQVDVDYMPAQMLQPALLNISVAAQLDLRMAVGEQRPLLDCRNCPRVDLDELGLGHLHIYAQDVAWARTLLADPANRATIHRLMGDQGEHGLRQVYLQPGKVWLRAHPSRHVTEAHIQQWFNDLFILAETAEGVR